MRFRLPWAESDEIATLRRRALVAEGHFRRLTMEYANAVAAGDTPIDEHIRAARKAQREADR